MILWVTFLIVISAFTVILRNIIGNLLFYKESEEDTVLEFYEAHRFVWFTAVDFLKGMTMLYLFYVQGKF